MSRKKRGKISKQKPDRGKDIHVERALNNLALVLLDIAKDMQPAANNGQHVNGSIISGKGGPQ